MGGRPILRRRQFDKRMRYATANSGSQMPCSTICQPILLWMKLNTYRHNQDAQAHWPRIQTAYVLPNLEGTNAFASEGGE